MLKTCPRCKSIWYPRKDTKGKYCYKCRAYQKKNRAREKEVASIIYFKSKWEIRKCLRCGKKFKSWGFNNRMCPSCRIRLEK